MCPTCGNSLEGMRSNAIYCSRRCKNVAADRRRVRDDAARYQAERERRLAYARTYSKSKPWIGQASRMRRKARMAAVEKFVVSGRDWRRLRVRHRGCCFYCGVQGALTMDHLIPISRGGRHSIGNIVPACLSCNSSKNARLVIEFRAGRSRARGKTAA